MGPAQRWAGAIAVVLVIRWAAPSSEARAYGVCRVQSDSVTCTSGPGDCDPATGCDGDDVECVAFDDEAEATYCRPACGTLFACFEEGDCPTLDGASGTCTDVDGRTEGMCAFRSRDPVIDYCVDRGGVVSPGMLSACHTAPDGTRTANYDLGDCDGDLCANAVDPDPCTAGDSCGKVEANDSCEIVYRTRDGGVDGGEGGARDGGARDGGARDGGGRDGGRPEPSPDGSFLDAGPGMDTGPPDERPAVGFEGAGGCAAAPISRPWGDAALLALAVLWLRGRGRRSLRA